MAKTVITFKIMPDSVDADLDELEKTATKMVIEYTGNDETKSEIEPVAFGLKAIKLLFVMDESKGSPDPLAEKIQALDSVMSCETTDVRRALG